MLNNVVLLAAGGNGSRFGSRLPKQYHTMPDGKSILEHATEKFTSHKLIDMVCLVINQQHKAFILNQSITYTYGGDTRQESIRLGLEFLQQYKPKNVLIHDAVRPFVSHEIISSVISKLDKYEAVDVAIPVTDTIKTYDGNTLPRNSIYATQTPQGFKFEIINKLHAEAFKSGKNNYTDDISLYLESGRKGIGIVNGCPQNIKITYKNDLL